MTSSSTGDRRWGTARRSGMTILGKVAVPKPINLPSQRLENQGLDPNVEIVPKGTLSWGSKSSLNAWGPSSLSPRTESGAGSPSHLSNRPSSGGTCTRPSTAGSDKAYETSANAWNPNSRPSSASGVLPSNQASLAPPRPHSAETRPCSSQLSRFAEAAPENSAVWGQNASEKLGVGPIKNDGFSLISGDFPSLGAEKASSGKSSGLQDHGPHVRPGSSSGRSAAAEERDANIRDEEVNTWRRDHKPYGEDGPRHGIEEPQMDSRGPQSYPNASFPPHHFDGWRGPPMNNHPGGVWYRGSPPAYGQSVGPRGFPMDPFPYYPQVPPAPGLGAGAKGNHPTNGDMVRPPIPDSYVCPGMPIRPGFYPCPVPYEGYYAPPMGYCNPSNRDLPFLGMPSGPRGYNKHSGQGGSDPAGRPLASDQVEAGHSQEPRGPYKVLLKPQEGQCGKDEAKWEESLTNRVPESEKAAKLRPSSNDPWRAEVRNDRNIESRRIYVSSETSAQAWEGGSSDTVKSKLNDERELFEAGGDVRESKEENTAPRDPSWMQKIESLNAKSCTGDGRRHASSVSSRDQQGSKSRTINAENYVNKFPTKNPQTIHASDSKGQGFYEQGDQATSRNPEQAAISRRSTQGTQGRADYQSKGRVINQDGDGWQKKAAISSSTTAIPTTNLESFTKAHMADSLNTDTEQKLGPVLLRKNEGESGISTDPNSQRSRMRELAKQRALQRQKEEEERARDQRAKALAKLEELNRRTQVIEEDSAKSVEAASGTPEAPRSLSNELLPSSSNFEMDHVGQPPRESNTTVRAEIYEEAPGQTRKSVVQEVMTSTEFVINADTTQQDNLPRVHDGGASKQKRMGYRQKQNVVFEKKIAGNLHGAGTQEAVDGFPSHEVVNEGILSHNTDMPATSSMTTELTYTKRKNNRNGKKKHKVVETTADDTSGHVGKETKSGGDPIETGNEKAAEMELGSDSVPCQMDLKKSDDSAEQITSVANEEVQGRAKNQWKSQHSRRPQRNSQGNKPAERFHGTDAVVWAPVRAQLKADTQDEASQKAAAESVASAKSGQQVQNNSKSKRVEMERYVPKPIAKEMAEQSVSKKEVAAPHALENAQKEYSGSEGTEMLHHYSDSTTEKSGTVSQSKHGNGRQNKYGRGHGSWRQHGPVESTKALEDVQFVTSDQNVQRTVNHHQLLQTEKSDIGFVREQTASHDDEWSDGWTMIPEAQDSTATVPQAVAVGKVQGMTARSKQQTFRGNKGGGSNYGEHKNVNNRDFRRGYVQHSGSSVSQSDLPGALKENRGPGDRSSSHWQPKMHTSISSDQRAAKFAGSDSTGAETDGANKKDMHNDGRQGFTREQRTTPPPDRHAQSQVQAPTNKDARLEQNSNLGFHKSTGQGRRYGSRGHDDSSVLDDSHHQRRPPSRDRPRHNSHYEYQPVGTKESSQTSGPRYREKGHAHQRNDGERFYQQQRGSVRRGDTGYD